MRKLIALTTAAVTMLSLVAVLAITTSVAAASTVTVTPSDIGVSWSTADTRTGGTVSFVPGPATPPLGTGSLQMTSDRHCRD